MIHPMTVKEARASFECQICLAGGDCGWGCVLSETCSFPCEHCGEKIFSHSSIQEAPQSTTCPYCQKTTINPLNRPTCAGCGIPVKVGQSLCDPCEEAGGCIYWDMEEEEEKK